MPDWLAPQLATLASAAPDTTDWVHEIKYDGYRVLAWVDGDRVRLMTRNRKDWTERFPTVVAGLRRLKLRGAILDGELVVEQPDGRSSFQALQNALSAGSTNGSLRFRVFDALYLDGADIRPEPLVDRKARLRARLQAAGVSGGSGDGEAVLYSEHVEGHGRAFHAQACRHGLEGIISKRAAAPYHGGRRKDWLKVKCLREQEFVVGGYTAPGGSRKGLGALHVGTFEGDRLVYRGKVGTGFTEATLRQLVRLLRPLKRAESPFADPPRGAAVRGTTWVEPSVVAQVRYTEVTDDGRLRHPVYHGVREDKPAAEVVFEEAPVGRKGSVDRVAGVRLSSPDKVLYPGSGVTKLELARYYEAMAEWMLPHIADRPLTLVRCPAGFEGNCFFQKHFDGKSSPAGVSLLEIPGRDGPELYGTLRSAEGLVSLVQLGTLELHTWNCRGDRVEAPDRFVMDIDPDPDLPWRATVDAALHLRELLRELGLVSALRTTGGKGLHVVVPIVRRTSWEDVKSFTAGVASLLAGAAPKLYTTDMAKAKRKGRILLDYLRNGRGATAIESYSTRARAGATVAMPLHWDELADGIRGDSFTVRNASARMKDLGSDPWTEISGLRQSITGAMMTAVGAKSG